MKYLSILVLLIYITSCQPPAKQNTSQAEQSTWISLFNGKDLDGWTPKFRGVELGENYGNTFRVVDSVIQVNYDQYDNFDSRYGHLFYKTPYSRYHLKLQYRFLGEQTPGGEGWAYKNSGVMYHCQDPKSMGVEQEFPVSLEAQFLGGNGTDNRPTANLCTPGTFVTMGDTLVTDHCISADAPTFHGHEWIAFEKTKRDIEVATTAFARVKPQVQQKIPRKTKTEEK